MAETSDTQSARVVFVTGASQGIGRVIAETFADGGDTVVLAARNEAKLQEVADAIEAGGGRALVMPTDVTDPTSVEDAVSATLEQHDHIDAVVANSGIGGPSGVLWELDPDEWDHTFAVNVRGVFLTARAILPSMIERRAGSLVVIGSISGKRPLYGRTAYGSTKAALVGLVRTLATEAGPFGIRVNLLSPGFVEGPRLDWVMAAQAEARKIDIAEVRREFEAESPLGRLTTAQDIANTALHLVSEQSAAITGADINVNSGVVMY
jgi:NAD(P)-dependent dehydrogenase (short-subunit alcohol dehydrogenase family)